MEEAAKAPVFDHKGLVRELIVSATHATLATLTADGSPFASLVALARDEDLCPIIITSHLSGHTGHMEGDARVSLLIASLGKGDPLAHPRVTLVCKAVQAKPGEALYNHLRQRYLGENPKAQLYVDLPGFWFWHLVPERVALNGGFGKAWSGQWSELAF
ncbi:MAG: HugZ family protein [Beijerinckiaceae bacterium]